MDLFAIFAYQAQHLVFSASKSFTTFCLISEYHDGFVSFNLLIPIFLTEHYYFSCLSTSTNSNIARRRGKLYSLNQNKETISLTKAEM